MADPTIAEVHTLTKAIVNGRYLLRLFAHVTSTANWMYLEDQVTQSLETDYAPSIVGSLAQTRGALVAALGSFRGAFDGVIRTYLKTADIATTDLAKACVLLREYFESGTPITFKERAWSRGTAAAVGSPSGNGVVRRLVTDRYSRDIQHCYVETRIAKCIKDANSGARRHQEVFEVRGGRRSKDGLDVTGSGIVHEVASVSAADSRLSNPTFSRYSGTAAVPTEITGWTPSAIGNFLIDETNYYRDFDGDSTSSGAASAAVQFKTNAELVQALSVRGDAGLSPYVPMYARIAYNRSVGSCDGNLTLTVGAVTETVALVAQSGWQILYVPLNQKCWLQTLNEQSFDVKITLASRTTGTLLVDDVIFVPWKRWGMGDYYIIDGGSTPWLVDDSWTFGADTETGSKVIGEWCRAFPELECPFPGTASPTISDP